MTAAKKEKIEAIYIDYLKKHGYMPSEIEKVRFYFGSDESVQKTMMAVISTLLDSA